jgi:hypothetical protein
MAKWKPLKGYKERNDLARLYRKLHRDRPDLARMLWRRQLAAFKILKYQVGRNLYHA